MSSSDATLGRLDPARQSPADSPAQREARCEALLERARPLSDEDCQALAELAAFVPGRVRKICEALAATETDAAAQALLDMPRETPGRIEAIYRAMRRGARRPRPGGTAPALLAFEFRRSRARDFAEVLDFVHTHFAAQLEQLEVEGKLRYRFRLDPLLAARGGAPLQTRLSWLQPRLSRRAGTRMWLNGWVFEREGPVSVHAHPHLLAAWLDWARGSAQTRRRIEIA